MKDGLDYFKYKQFYIMTSALVTYNIWIFRGQHGHDLMVVGFTTTCAISAYHHYCCEFEPRSGKVYSIQHYVTKFVSYLQQVGGFLRVLPFPPLIKLTAKI